MQDRLAQLWAQLTEIKTINNYAFQTATKLSLEAAIAKSSPLEATSRTQLKKITTWLNNVHQLEAKMRELQELKHLLGHELLEGQLNQELDTLEAQAKELYLATLFTEGEDDQPAFMEIQAGSGGLDAQDCAEMMMRMYLKFLPRQGLTGVIQDITYGDCKGIRSCTLEIQGTYAFGWLKTESGIHRFVRRSPFDAQHKRHTSFVSVYVYPKVSTPPQNTLQPSEIRIDTFKASGAGGQHVNKTDSAVRIYHLPTKIMVQCQSDRSQHRNRALAMAQLTSKLHQLALHTLRQQHTAQRQAQGEITWGAQIRSYIFDQSRVKDLRTNTEVNNLPKVLEGDLEVFIKTSLHAQRKKLWNTTE